MTIEIPKTSKIHKVLGISIGYIILRRKFLPSKKIFEGAPEGSFEGTIKKFNLWSVGSSVLDRIGNNFFWLNR
jgi:hypothetical protein